MDENGLTPLQGALAFVRSQAEIDRIIIGVDNAEHLREILVAGQTPALVAPKCLSVEGLGLIDPSKWDHL